MSLWSDLVVRSNRVLSVTSSMRTSRQRGRLWSFEQVSRLVEGCRGGSQSITLLYFAAVRLFGPSAKRCAVRILVSDSPL
jgi:hypothetical protein